MKKLLLLLLTSNFLIADFPIECEGFTQITYVDKKEKSDHTISCHGKVEIDLSNNYLQCLTTTHNPQKQVHFHDDTHDLYSDQLRATYTQEKGHLVLDKLKIYGHVCLIQKNDPLNELAFEEMQYALADHLDFDYKKELIVLRSKEDSNVLYYDQVNNYRIAADEVKVTRNLESQKALVKGIGKVRFTFDNAELENFKKHFFGKSKELENAKL